MTTRDLLVMPGERGRVRVFALSMTAQDARPLETIDPAQVEVFPVANLDGVGLTSYLIDGAGIPEDAVAPDRAKLEALDGHVMLVRSAAFPGSAEIDPAPSATLIATYAEDRTEWSPHVVSAAAAKTYSGRRMTDPEDPPQRTTVGPYSIIGIGAIVMAILYWTLR